MIWPGRSVCAAHSSHHIARILAIVIAIVASLAACPVGLCGGDGPWRELTILETPGKPGEGFYAVRAAQEKGRIAFSPDGKYLAWTHRSLIGDRFIRLHDLRTRATTSLKVAEVESFEFLTDSNRLLLRYGGKLEAWDTAEGRLVRELATRADQLLTAVEKDAVLLYANAPVSGVRRWSIADGSFTELRNDKGDFGLRLALSGDGKLLASGVGLVDMSPVRLWHATRPPGKGEKPVLDVPWVPPAKDAWGNPFAGDFSRSNKLLAVGGSKGKANQAVLKVLDTDSGTFRFEIPCDFHYLQFIKGTRSAFSRDERYLALMLATDLVIHDASSGAEVARLKPVPSHRTLPGDAKTATAKLLDFAFSPDGTVIATAWDDGTVRLWSGKANPLPPVIVLPGILGSVLQDTERRELIWPRVYLEEETLARLKLKWDEHGKVLPDSIKAVNLLRTAMRPAEFPDAIGPYEVPKFEMFSFYGKLIDSLVAEGYTPGKDLLILPYDWRQDNRSHLEVLDKIADVLRDRSGKKVILIGHSMGGLIARAYAASDETRAAKIDRIITLGTPYGGSPRAFQALTKGYDFGVFTLGDRKIQRLVQDYPSVYQLLPTRPFLRLETESVSLDTSFGFKYPNPEGAVLGAWGFRTMRTDLVKSAREFQTLLQKPSSVPTYTIIGVSTSTVTGFDFKPWTFKHALTDVFGYPLERRMPDATSVVGEPRYGNGDGTVPLESAILEGAAARYYVRDTEEASAEHSRLPGNVHALVLVRDILRGKPPASHTGPVPPVRDHAIFGLFSDGYLTISNTRGERLGPDEKGNIRREWRGGDCVLLGGREFITTPNGAELTRVKITGMRDGSATLEVRIVQDGKAARKFTYNKIPMSANTLAEVEFTPNKLVDTLPALNVLQGEKRLSIPAESHSVPAEPVAPTPTAPGTPAAPSASEGGASWLWIGGGGLGLLTVASFVVLCRRRNPRGHTRGKLPPTPGPVSGTVPKTQPPPPIQPGRSSSPLAAASTKFTIACPHCGVRIKVPTAACGRTIRCPGCANAIGIPSQPGSG